VNCNLSRVVSITETFSGHYLLVSILLTCGATSRPPQRGMYIARPRHTNSFIFGAELGGCW